MAIIKKYEELVNPNGDGLQFQQKISVSGAATSDVLVLPPTGEHSFTFSTTGSGKPQITCSSIADIDAGIEAWFDNDISGGPTLSAATIGTFRGVSAIKIVNVSGDSVLEVITKK